MALALATGASAPVRADEPPPPPQQPQPQTGARQPPAQLLYVREGGADVCPDEAAVRNAVQLRLGYDPFSPQAPRTVTATVRATPRGLTARIPLPPAAGDRRGRREITRPRRDCSDLAPAMELAIALAIDPLSATRPEAPSLPAPDARQGEIIIREMGGDDGGTSPPPLSSDPQPARPAPRPASPAGPRQTTPREPTRVRLGAGALLGIGGAPSVVYPGFELHVSFRETRWSVSIEARADVPIAADAANAPPARVSSMLLLAVLAPCVHVPFAQDRLELAACALVAGGAQFSSGTNLSVEGSQVSPSAHLGLRAALEWPFGGRFVLRPHADVLAALTRPDLVASGVTLYSTPAASGAVGLDLLLMLR